MLLAAGLAVHFVWTAADALRNDMYTVWAQGRTHAVVLVVCIYGAALLALTPFVRRRVRVLPWCFVVFAGAFSLRFHIVRSLAAANARDDQLRHRLPEMAPTVIVAFLRELSAAQEQYRLRQHSYAPSLDSLGDWLTVPGAVAMARMSRHGDAGWSARASLDNAHCSIWVRDSTLRTESWQVEGVPSCGQAARAQNRRVHTVLVPPVAPIAFKDEDVRGTWLQHRADRSRSATASSSVMGEPFRWTTRIGGELLASVSAAGNQVFVGAHGNGEFVALTLDSGLVGFRLRAPNWIHHEPVITADLVIVAFGNNELRPNPPPRLGTEPSGIAAYDRRTGVERWRRYTRASMMTAPVVSDSIIAGVSAAPEAIAWRVSDGHELWRTPLPDASPMGNPLLVDTLMIVGTEPATLCAFDVRTGRRVFCGSFARAEWGGGHESVSIAGSTLLFLFNRRLTLNDMLSERRWGFAMARALRLPGDAFELSEQWFVGADRNTGRERWRVHLGSGQHQLAGHIAGTATIVDGVAYVPSPVSGRVVAVRPESGQVVWSTYVHTTRGSLLVTQGAVLAATRDTTLVVLDAATGFVRCRQRLPGLSDRAGPTLAGETAIMTFRNGVVAARPIADWLNCRV